MVLHHIHHYSQAQDLSPHTKGPEQQSCCSQEGMEQTSQATCLPSGLPDSQATPESWLFYGHLPTSNTHDTQHRQPYIPLEEHAAFLDCSYYIK